MSTTTAEVFCSPWTGMRPIKALGATFQITTHARSRGAALLALLAHLGAPPTRPHAFTLPAPSTCHRKSFTCVPHDKRITNLPVCIMIGIRRLFCFYHDTHSKDLAAIICGYQNEHFLCFSQKTREESCPVSLKDLPVSITIDQEELSSVGSVLEWWQFLILWAFMTRFLTAL